MRRRVTAGPISRCAVPPSKPPVSEGAASGPVSEGAASGLEARASAIEKESDHEDENDQSNGAYTPPGAHSPIQSATAAQQQQQKYDDEYCIHGLFPSLRVIVTGGTYAVLNMEILPCAEAGAVGVAM